MLARAGLLIFFVIGLATSLLLPHALAQQTATKVVIDWNVGACLYLVLAAQMPTYKASRFEELWPHRWQSTTV